MLAYAGPERRRFLDLRRAVDESPNKKMMLGMVRGLEPDTLHHMDSMCRELYSISDAAKAKPKKDNQ